MTQEVELPSTYRLVTLESVDSTNEEAKRLAASGAGNGTIVWAGRQTAGKGRRGRTWVSEPGNLYCSILLRPDIKAASASHLSLLTGLAVADTVAAMVPPSAEVQVKWPNDVLIERRKVAGILLEAAGGAESGPEWVVVGVGINVAHAPSTAPGGSEFPATFLGREGYARMEVAAVLSSFALRFAAWRAAWRKLGFSPVRAAWLRRASGLGGPITVRLERETLEGTFADLDHDGALVLETAGERRRITAGDVFFGDA